MKISKSKTHQINLYRLNEQEQGSQHQSSNRQKMIISVKNLLNQIQLFQEQGKSAKNTLNRSNKTNELYNQLQTFDKIMKKYQIDQLSQIALEIYEYLVQKDTILAKQQQSILSNNKSKQNVKNNKKSQLYLMKDQLSKKFITVHIKQLQNSLPLKNHKVSKEKNSCDKIKIEDLQDKKQSSNIQSLQTPINMNLFSFAKNHQKQKSEKNQHFFSNMKLKGTKLSFNNQEEQKQKNKGKEKFAQYFDDNKNENKISSKSKSITQKISLKNNLRDQTQNLDLKAKNNISSSCSLVQNNSKQSLNKKSKKNYHQEERELYLSTLEEKKKQIFSNNKNQTSSIQKSQIINQTQPNEQQQSKNKINKSQKVQKLIIFIRQKRFRQFITCFNKQKVTLKNLFKLKACKFFYYQNTLRKCMKQLVLNWKNELLLQKRAKQYAKIKQEQILQEYFLQWKMRAQMSDVSRKKQEQIDQKSVKLITKIFFVRLSNFASQNKKTLLQNFQIEKNHKALTQKLLKSFFLKNLLIKTQKIKIQQTKVQKIKECIIYYESQCLLNAFKSFVNLKRTQQAQNIMKCQILVNGKQIIQKLKQNANFVQVYWKNWTNQNQNHGKLLFLSMLLSSLKYKLSRDGYNFEWMRELQSNLEYTDNKLKNPLKTKIKLLAFTGLKLHFEEQKYKKQQIRKMFNQRFLTCLAIYSYKKYKLRSLQQKSAHVQQLIFQSNSNLFITNLIQNNENSLQKKINCLNTYIKQQKSLQTFRFLSSYKSNKKYYQQRLQSFNKRWNKVTQQKYFFIIKRVLKQRIINKKLTQEYLYLKDRIMLENCFNSIKDLIFKKKLAHKKQSNFKKILLVKYFDLFLIGIRNTKGQKQTQEIHQCKQMLLQKNIKNYSYSFCQKLSQNIKLRRLKREIKDQIKQTVTYNLKAKVFQTFKLIRERQNKEKTMTNIIIQKKNNRIKRQIFQRMIQTLLIHEGLRKLIFLQRFQKINKRQSFQLLKQRILIKQK